MSTHSIHPDVYADGLADNCERCEEHAEHPFESLDEEVLAALIERVRNHRAPRSDNEALAMGHVRQALRICERIKKIEGESAND